MTILIIFGISAILIHFISQEEDLLDYSIPPIHKETYLEERGKEDLITFDTLDAAIE